MSKVFFISAGQLDIKKEKNIKNIKNMYLNYGALTLATIIKNAGYDVILIHGHFKLPKDFLEDLIRAGITKSNHPIFISIPSFYAIGWVKELTKLLKNRIKNKICVGGRWVIDDAPELLKKELVDIDDIICGLGENKILPYLKHQAVQGLVDTESYDNTPLNYELLYNRQLFQPSIEISRGCNRKCDFCQERGTRLTPLKPASMIVAEYENLILNDRLNKMNPYFECSNFIPKKRWLNDLIQEKKKNNIDFCWRVEGRVDSINPKYISLLAESGLKVIDLGLESASHKQIIAMNKSKLPETYLDKASALLKICYENDIKTKVNVLLYAGENHETIEETKIWLNKHRKYIYGVSVGPVLAFGWDKNKKDYIEKLQGLGASIDEENSILGVTKFNLSEDINYADSMRISNEISDDFMTLDNYFYLKSFSYYPRNYTKENFLSDLDVC